MTMINGLQHALRRANCGLLVADSYDIDCPVSLPRAEGPSEARPGGQADPFWYMYKGLFP